MANIIDVFNGDADGLCALHQLRLEEPAETRLVTGVKRDIALLARAPAQRGDTVNVLDVSVAPNREALVRLLDEGVRVRWFDHHNPGEVPKHPGLELHLDTSAQACTSLIVDGVLGGRRRMWAIVATFGDNLVPVGERLAREAGLPQDTVARLRTLGQCLNYNAYGESEEDLYYPPAELYYKLRPYADPLEFIRAEPVFARLDEGYSADMGHAQSTRPFAETPSAAAYVLPQEAWSRRVIGEFANHLAVGNPERAHAVLAPRRDGLYVVSVRAPVVRPEGADRLCLEFETGGGRKGAAGIMALSADAIDRFVARFQAAFGEGPRQS